MAQHARIEELSDSSTDSDPPEDDIDDIANTYIRPANKSPPTTSKPQIAPQPQRQQAPQPPPPEYKHYQCIYPVYFDANRTRAQGRRVGAELAVHNPLAREIVDAVQLLGLQTVFEPGKMHPKDWANPGRVRVLIKEGGKARSSRVKNKNHLYTLISAHLKAHPTTPETPLRLRIQGMPPPTGPAPPPAVPRGWKMGTVLPLHSPALSGGGVSENILKDVMQEMQGVGGAGGLASLMGGAGAGAGESGSGGRSGGGSVEGPSVGKKRKEKKK